MSEPEPIYLNDTPAAKYWYRRAAQERGRANDNLRLAAERASEIAELKQELQKTKAEIERLKQELDNKDAEIALLKKWQEEALKGGE